MKRKGALLRHMLVSVSMSFVVVTAFSYGTFEARAQESCQSQAASIALPDLFTGFSPVSEFSLSFGKTNCSYFVERFAGNAADYQGCVDWKVQKKLERAGRLVIGGIEANDGGWALLGSRNFGLTENLTYRRANNERTFLQGSHGLKINLLGAELPLPRQDFSISLLRQSGDRGDRQSLGWQWETFRLDVGLSIPVPLFGDMGIDFKAEFDGGHATATRLDVYGDLADVSDWDWGWYNDGRYWNDLHLWNRWGVDILSPSIGLSVAGIGAEIRLVVGSEIDGDWRHSDPHDYHFGSVITAEYPELEGLVQPSDTTMVGAKHGELYTRNSLTAGASVDGRIRGTIKVFGLRLTKEWKVIEIGDQADRDLDGSAGRLMTKFAVPVFKPPYWERCPSNPSAPKAEEWFETLLTTVPETRPEEQPVDLRPFASSLTDAVRETYYICDMRRRAYDPINDPGLHTLIKGMPQGGLTQADEKAWCKKINDYLSDKFFLCERDCSGGVCLHRKEANFWCGQKDMSALPIRVKGVKKTR